MKKTYKPRRQKKIVQPISETSENQILFNVHQAARVLAVSVWSVREWINAGVLATVALPSVKGTAAINRRVLISRATLDEFAARYSKPASAIRDVTISRGAV